MPSATVFPVACESEGFEAAFGSKRGVSTAARQAAVRLPAPDPARVSGHERLGGRVEDGEDNVRRWIGVTNGLGCEDGPAVEYADGSCEWWLLGQQHQTREQWSVAVERHRRYRALI